MSHFRAFAKKVKDWFLAGYSFLNRENLYVFYVFSFFFVLTLLPYFSIDRVFAMDDHFFHIKFSEVFREEGVRAFTDFQSIYFSKMGIGHEYLVYYNFLFYIVLLPFTFLTPLIFGIKMYGVVVVSLSLTAVYVFLRKVSVKHPFLWVVLFLGMLIQSGLLFRFSLARPFTLAPVFLVVMLLLIHQKRHFLSALISFLYFYWHTATFFFPLALAAGYFLFEQFYGKRPDWKMVIWPTLGTGAAVLFAYAFSPGVIAYLRDVIFPVFFDTALFKDTGVAEGGEVYGKNFFDVFSSFFWFLAFFVVLGIYEVLRYIRSKRGIQEPEEAIDMPLQPLRATLFMATLVFWLGSFFSARFLDDFVYFCILYIALAVTDVGRFFMVQGKALKQAVRIGIPVVVVVLFSSFSLNLYDVLGGSPSHMSVQGPAEWLNYNLSEGKIIFNLDWSAFPTLYYFTGDKFRYTTGLEPRFLYDLDPRMYWIWRNIGDNAVYCEQRDCEEIIKQRDEFLAPRKSEDEKSRWYKHQGDLMAESIMRDFQTDIIVVSNQRTWLLDVFDHSDRFKQEFFDEKNSAYAIYRIVGETEKK
ncbi:MAG: hypothetical protein KBD65_01740 [Candidatus Moranbacteria bacterium]|nr:hypothetical protein [Candidatus Moranbacteria bacterium]